MAYCYDSRLPKPLLLPDGSLPGEAAPKGAPKAKAAAAAAPAAGKAAPVAAAAAAGGNGVAKKAT
jgi:hypothetical protein